eukprot:TRINITY_DN47143_c0_g1_i1.p1 TRINITY_DN47143_c0_g1~~TRINITY_DN47143_c0_g1_i1.p1  ORF type:complete len:302 (+),score=49.36 TRINITY_DN47143_c0_g1_i1:170-1075(+)
MLQLLLLVVGGLAHAAPASAPASGLSAGSPQPYVKLSPRLQKFYFDQNGWCVSPSSFHAVLPRRSKQHSQKKTMRFVMRNVPGEGDCMFLAVAMATAASMGLAARTRTNGLPQHDETALLRALAEEKREAVAKILTSKGTLHIAGRRLCTAKALLRSAASAEGLNPDEYVERLKTGGRCGGLNGGGPELTILSNILRRPISMYEICKGQAKAQTSTDPASSYGGRLSASPNSASSEPCLIERVGKFGDAFEDPCASIPNSAVVAGQGLVDPGSFSWGLHILVLDVAGGALEKHACALLPTF